MLTRLRIPFAVFLVFAGLCYLRVIGYAQLPQCRISGTLYTVQGQPNPKGKLTIFKVVKSGTVIISDKRIVSCNSLGQVLDPVDGLVGFNVPRDSTAYFYANAPGLDAAPTTGTPYAIPDAVTATLEGLISVSQVPSTGLTFKDEGTSLASLIGTVNVVGTAISVTQASPGVATLTATGGSGTVTSVAATVPSFLSLSGSPITTSGTLAFSLANQSANLVFAGPGTGSAATPTFRSLVTADLPTGIPNANLANSSLTVNGTANRLTGGGSVSLGASLTLNVDTSLLPSPGAGDVGKSLVATGANAAGWSTVSGGATAALDNLSSVAINSALLPASAAGLDFGSALLPWKDLYLAGSSGTPGANNFKITGASTSGTRTVTLANGDSNTVIPDTGAANNFLTAIAATGVISKAQPTFANLASTPTTFAGYGISDSSANLATAITDETGSGLLMFNASPRVATSLLDTNGNPLLAITATGTAIFGATLTNAASGGTVAWGVTTPTQAASGIAGTPVSFRASDAVAGSSNAGAVAGGAVTITSGAAARLTSGNANGGNISLVTGAGIGTGTAGQVLIPTGATAAPGLAFTAATATGLVTAVSAVKIVGNGTDVALFRSSAIEVPAAIPVTWVSAFTSPTSGIGQSSSGVLQITNGTSGQWGALLCGVRDAGTTTVTNAVTVGHQSTGTPAAGFGTALLFNLNSSTTADQNAGQIAVSWTVATHAGRTARFDLNLVNNAAALASVFGVLGNGLIIQPQTVTAGGTTGAQTIDKPAGTVNIAAGQTTIVVTNALVTANSQVFAVIRTNDTTSQVKNVVPTAGSFTITLVAAATAETSIGFWVINQ